MDNNVETNNYIDEFVDDKIDKINSNQNVFSIGKITKIRDYIIEVSGLDNVMYYEKININNKAVGYVVKIEPTYVVIAILQEKEKIVLSDTVYQTNEIFAGDFSKESFGKVIDMFGFDCLVNKKFEKCMKLPVEIPNVPIMDRRPVNRPFLTGIAGIDLLYPIGKGQRQLIIGDKKIGKTQICLDTIVNQIGKNVLCLYVAIGKTKKEVKEIYTELVKRNAMNYTIIITAFNDEKPSVLTLTPYFAMSVATYYMLAGFDCLVILDDLKRHADAYREISLVSGKTPGRNAYPADIFYFHSRLLEKGCQYKNGASITILPIVETKNGDITDYISTNIISITDGQIVLSAKNFKKGEKPAINYGLSVSRLGGSVQSNDIKKMGSVVRQKLLGYLETRDVYELANIDESNTAIINKMNEGKEILSKLQQYKYHPLSEKEIIESFTKYLGDSK